MMIMIPTWQVSFLCGILTWIIMSSFFNLTHIIRSLIQSWVSSYVISSTPIILQIQGLVLPPSPATTTMIISDHHHDPPATATISGETYTCKYQHTYLDGLFTGLSCVVSVPFYTGFLPLLFWSGHGKLARQMTLLMAFCDYAGNCIKDVVSAPRPASPLVRRLTVTEDEKENAMEYGLPSSHTLNTVCLSGYLLHYVLSYNENPAATFQLAAFAFVCLFVVLIGLGRIYLGMHSVIDIIGGLVFGFAILHFWLCIHEHVDQFVVSGQNVTSFWIALSLLLLFAYPTPELPTPSFEYHTAFTGVALGIVTGVQQTYDHFHHEDVARVFTSQLPVAAFIGRILVGIPTILLVKFCAKALAKWILPITANALGIPIQSSGYVPALIASPTLKKSNEVKQSNEFLQKMLFYSNQDSFDVDTGIRLLQYAGLAWSVVDLVPTIFFHLNL